MVGGVRIVPVQKVAAENKLNIQPNGDWHGRKVQNVDINHLKPIHQWKIGQLLRKTEIIQPKMTIELYRQWEKFYCKTTVEDTGVATLSEIIDLKANDKSIQALKESVISKLENDVPTFSPHKHTWTVKKKEITLFNFQDDLIFQIVTQSKDCVWELMRPAATLNQDDCTYKTKVLFGHNIKTNPLSQDVPNKISFNFLKDYVITKCVKTPCSDLPYWIYMQPISADSKIDARIQVSASRWGVTLVTSGGCLSSCVKTAKIIVEGIKNGNYFLYSAEYKKDEKRIEADDISPQLSFEKRTGIWIVDHEKAREMIKKIDVAKVFLKKFQHTSRLDWAKMHLKFAEINPKDFAIEEPNYYRDQSVEKTLL